MEDLSVKVSRLTDEAKQYALAIFSHDSVRSDLRELNERIDGLASLACDSTKINSSALIDRAEELHLKARMPWREAEELALEEIGFTDVELKELIGEAGASGDCILTREELERYTRAVLVHGSPYILGDQPGAAPGGFWIAPMLVDTAMLRAGYYFETDERIREFWLALRNSWISRHPHAGEHKVVTRAQAQNRMNELHAEMRLLAPLLGLEEVIGDEEGDAS